MLKKLNDFNIGETGQITTVEGEGKIRRRLFDMGVTPGAELTLRKSEANLVVCKMKGEDAE